MPNILCDTRQSKRNKKEQQKQPELSEMERRKNRKIKISLSELAQSCKQNVTIFEEDMTQKLLMNTKTKKTTQKNERSSKTNQRSL